MLFPFAFTIKDNHIYILPDHGNVMISSRYRGKLTYFNVVFWHALGHIYHFKIVLFDYLKAMWIFFLSWLSLRVLIIVFLWIWDCKNITVLCQCPCFLTVNGCSSLCLVSSCLQKSANDISFIFCCNNTLKKVFRNKLLRAIMTFDFLKKSAPILFDLWLIQNHSLFL